MMIWKQRYDAADPPKCGFRTKQDFVIGSSSRGNKRKRTLGGAHRPFKDGVESFEISDSEYADDTAVLFPSREELAKWAPLLIKTFADFGMEVHVKQPGDTKEKTIVLFVAVQGSEYNRFHADAGGAATYGGTDLSDITLPCGGVIPVKEKAKYLGSWLNRNANHAVDIEARISKASAAFGRLKPLVFKNKGISLPAKRAVYVAIVMSILLYGSEMWVISVDSRRKLRSFHNRCLRVMCGVNMWHVQHRMRCGGE